MNEPTNSGERCKDLRVPYWVDMFGLLIEVNWDKKPSMKYRPLTWADRPVKDDRLKELWDKSGGKVKAFARLLEQEHGIKEWEVEDRERERDVLQGGDDQVQDMREGAHAG